MNLPPFTWGKRWHMQLGVNGRAYLRCSMRASPSGAGGQQLIRCLDFADLTLPEEERGRGVFRAFLAGCERALSLSEDYEALFVENVLNVRLATFFERHLAYRLYRADVGAPSYLRVL